jgi:muramoyltetrapeptide carboxypeptidase
MLGRMRYPAPLRPGDRVAVVAPSSPVPPSLRPRLDVAVGWLRERGYDVEVGRHVVGQGVVSAGPETRAAELSELILDPEVRAVVPPWGGELAIDLVGLLDWAALTQAEPTWMVGYSDISTLITPLTMLTGVATVHGVNLMDTPYEAPGGLLHWLDVVTAHRGATLVQEPPGRYRARAHDDFAAEPALTRLTLDAEGRWEVLNDTAPVQVSGRLVGGCIETLGPLAGSRYVDGAAFAAEHGSDGLLVYVEAAQSDATDIARHLHGMRLSGFFDGARAVLVGRSAAPDAAGYTQRQAVLDALGPLEVPLVAGVECGHVAPFMPVVNGSWGTVEVGGGVQRLTQRLV